MGETGTPHPTQYIGLAPFTLGSSGQDLATNQNPFGLELPEHGSGVDPVALAEPGGREWPMGAGITGEEVGERIRPLLQTGLRQPPGGRDTERIAVHAGIFGGDEPGLAVNPDLDHPALLDEILDHGLARVTLGHARLDLGKGEVTDPPEDLLESVAIPGSAVLAQMLK